MDRLFDGVIDRTRAPLNLKTLKTIFGYKHRPFRRRGVPRPAPRFQLVIEKPVYDLTVFKVHFGRLTVKIYTKGERVLRTEAIAPNTTDLHGGRMIEKFGDMVAQLGEMLERFLCVLRGVDVSWISDETLACLPTPSLVGKTRVGGVNINQRRIRTAMEAVVGWALSPRGFTASEHAAQVRAILAGDRISYTPCHAAYDLKKLRGKGLVQKVPDRSRHYEPTAQGLTTMAGLVVLRDKVLKPLLANVGQRRRGRKLKNRDPLDDHYDAIQYQMQRLFKAINFAA